MTHRPLPTKKLLQPHGIGQIGYALAPQVAVGSMLGADQPIILHLLDVEPAKNALEGLRMELVDGAYPLLEGESRGQSLRGLEAVP